MAEPQVEKNKAASQPDTSGVSNTPAELPDENHRLPQSATVNHILEYPVVQDSIWLAFDSNPFSRLGKSAGIWTYKNVVIHAVPLLHCRPVSWLEPVAKKADDFSDRFLNNVDRSIPEVQKPTKDIVDDVKTIACLPWTVSRDTLSRYGELYDSQCKKFPEEERTLYVKSKARLSALSLLGSEGLTTASRLLDDAGDWILRKREEAAEAAQGAKITAEQAAQRVAEEAGKIASKMKGAVGEGSTKVGAEKEEIQEKVTSFKDDAKEEATAAMGKANDTADEGKKKMESMAEKA